MKGRDISIDWLKVMAVLFVFNSHLEHLYGSMGFMATGGMIGVGLFFFCSGFTLLLKPMEGVRHFPEWYKRRIIRIYPTVFAFAIIDGAFFHNHRDIVTVIFTGCGWFVQCIMVYYVIIFFIGSYLKNRLKWVAILWPVLVAVCFLHAYHQPGFFMFTDPFQRIPFFLFMLMGAMTGLSVDKIKIRPVVDALMLMLCIVAYYLIIYFSMRNDQPTMLQFFCYFPALGTIYYFYKVFRSKWAASIYRHPFAQSIIRFVGGLCLEIYLIQFSVITTKLNHLFPLNILIVFAEALALAYLTRCLARFILQTFSDKPYDWTKMVKI
ncbi:MAG: acyltransferase [Prevotella sp.]|nr:acyltransferase [Prevotella sp.]